MIKISVIVPVYNCEDYIEESIKSILNQSFNDIEVICVDDGSTDDSLKILKELSMQDNRLKVYTQKNQGSSVARNNALEKASGDYIYFFDADDYVVENCLEKVYSNALNNDSDMVIFYYDNYDGDAFLKHCTIDLDKKFSDVDYNNFTFNYKDYKQYAFKGASAPWFKLYKKEFLKKYDNIKFPVNLNHNDVPFHIMTVLKASKISFLPEFLYHYRVDNPNSISNTRLKSYKDIFCIINLVEDFLKTEGLFDDLKKEFDFLKIDQIIYQIRGRSNDYFDIAKKELSCVDLNNDYLTKPLLFKTNSILNSDSIDEYELKVEIYNYENKINSLNKKVERLVRENKKLKKDLEKSKNINKDILNSLSWRMTKPLRRFKQLNK